VPYSREEQGLYAAKRLKQGRLVRNKWRRLKTPSPLSRTASARRCSACSPSPSPPRPPPPFLADPPLEDLFCSRAIPVNRAGEIKEEEGKKKQISTFLELLLSHNGSCFLLFFLIPPTFPDIYIYIYIYIYFFSFLFVLNNSDCRAREP